MAKSLQQVLDQIAKLEQEAQALRQREKSGVVARIREAIAHYQLTPEDLFGNAPEAAKAGSRRRRAAAAKGVKTSTKAARKPASRKPAGIAKYGDGTGRTWSGHGKRPNWFKEALAAGKSADDLLIQVK